MAEEKEGKDFRNKSRSFALRPSFFMIDGDFVRFSSKAKKGSGEV
jgi:hypothetical protein